jgi:hypothetical protein
LDVLGAREKILFFGGAVDTRRTDSFSGSYDDDGMSTDDGVQSLRSTPTHPSCSDRISIEDFYILKPISRGAFGRVFLAKKRSTGDLFAIKVSYIDATMTESRRLSLICIKSDD